MRAREVAGWDSTRQTRDGALLETGGVRAPVRRGVAAFAFLCVGLVIGRALLAGDCGFLQVLALPGMGFGGAAMALCARGWWARAGLAVGAVGLGAGWFVVSAGVAPGGHLSRALTEDAALVTVEGYVASAPEAQGSQRGLLAPFARYDPVRTRFDLRVARVMDGDGAWRRASGVLWVRVDAEDVSFGAGSWVRATGMARCVGSPRNPGEIDMRPIALDRGVAGSLRCATAGLVEVIESPPGVGAGARLGAWWARVLGESRSGARSALAGAVGAESRAASLLGALLLGARDERFAEISAPFVRTGVAHVLAISGLHVGIFVGAVALAVRLTGDRPRLETAMVLVAVALVLVLIPARAPVVRACAIIAGLVATRGTGRRYDGLNTLAWIGVGVLLWRPTELWNPGFALSFGIVAGLMGLSAGFREGVFGAKVDPDHRTVVRRVRYWLEDGLSASVCAWAVALPLVAFHFGLVTPYAPLTSLLMLPLVGVMLIAGYGVLVFGAMAPELGAPAGGALAWLGEWMVGSVVWLEGIPGSAVGVPRVGVVWTGVALVVVCVCLRSARFARGVFAPHPARPPAADSLPSPSTPPPPPTPQRGEGGEVTGHAGSGHDDRATVLALSRIARFARGLICPSPRPSPSRGEGGEKAREVRLARLGHAALAVGLVWVVAWPVFVALRGVGPREGVVLRWDALDVGDGSAHLLRSGGEAVMFDCGSSWYGVGERVLPRAMRALGAWRAATVIVSHPDSDHYSGLLDCASPLGVERVIVGEAFVRAAGLEADGPEAFVLAGLEARGVEVVVVSAGAVVEFGGARMTALWPPEGYVAERDNDASLVWLVEAGGWRVLLTGDIEAEAMDGVGRAAPGLRVDAMEAPHHGSARGFAYGFVEGMLPRVVVQSTGVSRLGDERWDGVKEGVERWLVTARDGAVWVEFGSRPGELTAGAPRSQRGEESEER